MFSWFEAPVHAGVTTSEATGSSTVAVTASATGKRIRLGTGATSVSITASASAEVIELTQYPPIAVLSNDGWDTGPVGGGDLVDALETAGSDYITVTA